jgi:glycine dehydrogenase subunit 1
MMCTLTGQDVSNASVYDGAVAAAEAVFMCLARNKNRILVSATVNPETLAVIKTYCESRSVIVDVVGLSEGQTDLEELSNKLDSTVCAVLVQSPNFYGILEETVNISEISHNVGAKMILSANPIAFGLLKSAKEQGADICVGEGQPLGLPLSFGGPYLGYMTATKEMMRKLPGRIVGQTVDHDGNRCFVLTLQAREQHIRREKASSNICSNEALCAMTASVYLAAVGPDGLKQVAENSASYAHYMLKRLQEVGFKLRYDREFFNEFLVESPVDIDLLESKLAQKGILSGLKTDEGLLLCCTEMNTVKEIDAFVETVKEVL